MATKTNEEIRAYHARRRAVAKAYVSEIRNQASCAHCGASGVRIDFHRPEHKSMPHRRVAILVGKGQSLRTITEEIALCTPLCRPCHIRADDVPGFRPLGKKGGKNNQAKLTEADIPVIREMIRMGMKTKDIGSEFGVHFETINAIRRGQSWTHVQVAVQR